MIDEERASLTEQRQRLAEAEKQERQADALVEERRKQSQEIQNLDEQIERTQARIDALQEEHGSNIESETELNRLKLLKRIITATLKKKKKDLDALEKRAKDKEKIQAKVDREKKKLYEKERETNRVEESLNSTKRLDELEDDEHRLKRLNEEDQAIIDDLYASEFDKEAARERMAARDEDLFAAKSSDIGKRKFLAFPRKDPADLSKIWRDRDGHLFGRGRHNRRRYWGNYQRFEKTRNIFGK